MTREEYIKALEHTLEAARAAIVDVGHDSKCSFTACNCGAAKRFAVSHLEFWRRWNDLRAAKTEPPQRCSHSEDVTKCLICN